MSTLAEPTVDAPASEWIEWLITPAVAEDDKRRLATRMVEEMRDLQAQVERLEARLREEVEHGVSV